ncbi:MAG: NusA-like transcription termination signal-binding factor [Candidatus Diapherotrites archaeon]
MKISNEEILYINALSNASNVTAKDCLIGEGVISFLVNGKDLGKAIGKNASTVKTLSQKLKKNVEIFGYFKEVKEFIKKAFHNVKIDDIEIKENNESKEVLLSVDFENKRKLFSNRKRMDRIKQILERNYKVTGIRIK